ncbi:MAG: hypothetical protein ABJJ25_10910 [Eudoraea sp.]|uniref:hypothetical protein n=1 Tax=Eudoraea sp. TaxID=1979955 RepID=UPI0032652536
MNLKKLFYILKIGIVFIISSLTSCGGPRDDGYFVDAEHGDDSNSGTSRKEPWQTVEKVNSMIFKPGDNIYFKRQTSYSKGLQINGDGTEDAPILIGAWGEGDAPRFTNTDDSDYNGNCIQLNGHYQILENIYCFGTNDAPGRGYLNVWKIGGIKINLGADHCIVRNNEVEDCPIGINSYGEHTLITENYVHDCNRPILFPYWGPIGIRLGMGNQEVSWNKIHNYHSMGGEWGGDGGAIEIDDGRNPRNNIYIHHNKSNECMGFCEISYNFDICGNGGVDCATENRIYDNIVIAYNESADYRTFTQFWAPLSNSFVENNTVYRKWESAGIESNVFCENDEDGLATDSPTTYRNNLVVVVEEETRSTNGKSSGMGNRIYLGYPLAQINHSNNLFYNVDGPHILFSSTASENIELEATAIIANPKVVDLEEGDYHLTYLSPARDNGADEGHYDMDLDGNPIVGTRDIGAFEYQLE